MLYILSPAVKDCRIVFVAMTLTGAKAMKAGKDGSERRTDERMEVAWRGVLILADERRLACRVSDVSLAGTLVKCPEAAVALGDEIILDIPTLGEFAGKVRWLDAHAFGLALEAGPDLALKSVAEDDREHPDLMPATRGIEYDQD